MSPLKSRLSTSGSPARSTPAFWPAREQIGLLAHRDVVAALDGLVDLVVAAASSATLE